LTVDGWYKSFLEGEKEKIYLGKRFILNRQPSTVNRGKIMKKRLKMTKNFEVHGSRFTVHGWYESFLEGEKEKIYLGKRFILNREP
jgi:hypothetical protein